MSIIWGPFVMIVLCAALVGYGAFGVYAGEASLWTFVMIAFAATGLVMNLMFAALILVMDMME